jgi:hypothetical protein
MTDYTRRQFKNILISTSFGLCVGLIYFITLSIIVLICAGFTFLFS